MKKGAVLLIAVQIAMKRLLLLLVLALAVCSLTSINVGGHILQDTIWYPANNPHAINSFLYIDAGVSLTERLL